MQKRIYVQYTDRDIPPPCRISKPLENVTNSSQRSLYLLLNCSQCWSDLWQIFNIPERQFRLGSGKERLVQLKLEGDFR